MIDKLAKIEAEIVGACPIFDEKPTSNHRETCSECKRIINALRKAYDVGAESIRQMVVGK